MQAKYLVAVDVGGTFMDFVLMDERTGEIRIEKVPSLSDQLPTQFMKGLAAFGVGIDAIARIFHGVTVGVSAPIQERGAKVGLITTKGLRDVLEMGRGGRKPVYDFVQKGPPRPFGALNVARPTDGFPSMEFAPDYIGRLPRRFIARRSVLD